MIVGYINGQGLEIHHSTVVEKSVDYLTADFFFMTKEWQGFEKFVHFVKGDTHYKIRLTGDKVLKSDQLNLSSGLWDVYLHGVLKTEIITTSRCRLNVESTGDISGGESGDTAIKRAVEQAQEEYRSELETSLETATGESHDNKTWDELNETISTLPVISEEQTQALGEWDLIKEYFADYAYPYHQLFFTSPKDADGNDRTYRLPYIYTPKMKWRNNQIISPYLVEYGADVSSATTLQGGIFSNNNNLQRLVLTGNANADSMYNFVFGSYALRYIKFETPSETVLKANPKYYQRAFLSCERLQTIDCELDFTGQTDTTYMLRECYLLKDLRIKPFTLSTSLDLGTCRSLHHNDLHDYDSLISILNGITYDKEISKNITITLSSEITDFTQGTVRFWNRYVYFCDDGIYYTDPSEVPEGYAYLEMPLYDAFMSKGVTIAWKQ